MDNIFACSPDDILSDAWFDRMEAETNATEADCGEVNDQLDAAQQAMKDFLAGR